MSLYKPRALILDIEGTTTPIDFVYRTLFPYAREHLPQFLAEGFSHEDRAQIAADYAADDNPDKPAWSEPPLQYLLWLMDRDIKARGLKTLQGKIWEAGYASGHLRGELFSDVPPALSAWRNLGNKVYLYSSGSVLAQKLLFRSSNFGNLSELIDGYFDTTIGSKKNSESYQEICNETAIPAAACAFVSDSDAELRAAARAGMRVLLSVRSGNSSSEWDGERVHDLGEALAKLAAQ